MTKFAPWTPVIDANGVSLNQNDKVAWLHPNVAGHIGVLKNVQRNPDIEEVSRMPYFAEIDEAVTWTGLTDTHRMPAVIDGVALKLPGIVKA